MKFQPCHIQQMYEQNPLAGSSSDIDFDAIDEMDNELRIPFAYQMYGTNDSITYHLSTHELDLENTQWELHL